LIDIHRVNNCRASPLNAGMRSYAVIHNGITYPFSFSDDPAKFDNPESTKTRERILNSIRFTNDTSPWVIFS